MILLLELFEPTVAVDLQVAVRTAHGSGKESGLVSDDVVVQRQALTLMVPGPV